MKDLSAWSVSPGKYKSVVYTDLFTLLPPAEIGPVNSLLNFEDRAS